MPVAVAEGGGTLAWVEPADRKQAWDQRLRDRTFNPKWTPPDDAPGSLPFEVMRFGRDGHVLLLFYDWD